jgi:hypothetical protein
MLAKLIKRRKIRVHLEATVTTPEHWSILSPTDCLPEWVRLGGQQLGYALGEPLEGVRCGGGGGG